MSAEVDRRAEIEALLVLDQLPRVGLRTLKRVVERFGSAADALGAAPKQLVRAIGHEAAAMSKDPAVLERVRSALDVADCMSMRIVTWTDGAYPPALRHLVDPPPLLFLRGRAELLETPGVTVVGARRATARGRETARRLARALADAGCTVVSGLALGVDGAAHEGALEMEGDTVAVLGRGADAAYPPSHRGLFRRIVSEGLVVSEFLPGTPALGHHFPRRNRILAALARAVVVVEASARSGALITVEHALDLGVEVYAVPGPIEEAACAGSNALLRDGGRPLVSIRDFVRDLTGVDASETPGRVSGEEAVVLEGLVEGSRHVDELAARAGLTVPRALALLSKLEVRGRVEQLPGMRFRRAG